MARKFTLTEADRQRISAAVTHAEANSAGEIVTILTEKSDDYSDVALAWAAAIGLLALIAYSSMPQFYLSLIDRITGAWGREWPIQSVLALATAGFALKFAGMWLMQLWRPLRLWLVPPPIKRLRVRQRAVSLFRVGAEQRTVAQTGILIYLSLAERRAEIVAEAAIAARVEQAVWDQAMTAMLVEIKAGQLADGLIAGIAHVGAVLAEHFPRAADDVNELPDRLIEV